MKTQRKFSTPTPVIDMIYNYAENRPFRYHTPGHKGALGYDDFFRLDITELLFSDTLHDPKGAILEAERLAASFYGALRTHFLINGASSGVLAALLGLRFMGGRKVIVARHSHKSVFNGCMLAGIEPVIVDNESDNDINVPLSHIQIEEALAGNPDCDAVLITHPNYYGMCRDIIEIHRVVKSHDKLLFVDQAHGAHYAASELLPVSASGLADICVDSAHKTMPALTQAAFLSVNNPEVESAVSQALNTINSTSPSYLLMASLDYARAYMQENSRKYARLKILIDKLKAKYPSMFINNDDFTRLVLDVSSLNISGRTAEKFLNQNNIYPEFADRRYVVFIISLADNKEALDAVARGIELLKAADLTSESRFVGRKVRGERTVRFVDITPDKTELIPLSESEGRVCCNEVGFFPPCLPILVRGETITAEVIEYISSNIENTFGLYGDKVIVIK